MRRLIKDLTLWVTHGHLDTGTYPIYVTWGAGFLFLMAALGLTVGSIYATYQLIVLLTQSEHVATVTDASPGDKDSTKAPDKIESQGGSEVYTFTDSWRPKDDNSKINEDGSLSLKDGQVSSIYEYGGAVPLRSDYGMSFVTRAVFGPNLVIGRPSFYEITVGDMSSAVITLKATDKLDGGLIPIEEVSWAKYRENENALRPRTENCQFVSGEEIKVDIVESFIESTSQFKVDVTVTCNDKTSDTFSWIFTPPPKWVENEKLHFAIIDDAEGSNSTRIDFLDPIVIEARQESE